jgi:hypothetical protein
MKNYKVKATVNFPDKTTHQRRTLGEEFICTEERYNELKFKNVIELVEIIEENDEIDTNMIKLIAKPVETIKFVEKVVEKSTEEIVEKKPRKRRTTKKEN